MISHSNVFLENTVVSFSFGDMGLSSTEMKSDSLKVVLYLFKDGAELPVAIEIADVEPVAVVQSQNLV